MDGEGDNEVTVGCTSCPGSAVVDAVLANGKYTPRAITRSLDSAKSKALIAKGVEVVSGNLWDKESLKTAIRGSEAVFGNTNFWDPEIFPADPKGSGEITQGKNLVNLNEWLQHSHYFSYLVK
ncbi:hypothetical protein B0H14DRAFT_3549780 [Mycena olivaceomarginata]|nr:hypothetical protein B0H14DRAFT_3549780 [Mycena olivaceomarginata]